MTRLRLIALALFVVVGQCRSEGKDFFFFKISITVKKINKFTFYLNCFIQVCLRTAKNTSTVT